MEVESLELTREELFALLGGELAEDDAAKIRDYLNLVHADVYALGVPVGSR